jgi:hypothetical protein
MNKKSLFQSIAAFAVIATQFGSAAAAQCSQTLPMTNGPASAFCFTGSANGKATGASNSAAGSVSVNLAGSGTSATGSLLNSVGTAICSVVDTQSDGNSVNKLSTSACKNLSQIRVIVVRP